MKLFLCVMALSFFGLSLQAGVMPEETSNRVLETIIGFNDQQIDYSSDIVEPAPSFKEKIEDLIYFTRNTILDNDNYIQLNHLRDDIIRKWSDFDWNIYGSFKEFLETSIKGLKIIYDNKKQWATLSI